MLGWALAESFAQQATVTKHFLDIIYGQEIYATQYKHDAFYFNDPDSPVKIHKVTAVYTPKSAVDNAQLVLQQIREHQGYASADVRKYQYEARGFDQEQVMVTVVAEGHNTAAVKFGVLVVDSFGDILDRFTAITMDPLVPTEKMKWRSTAYNLFTFKGYGVVGVYVRQVRTRDGKLWEFNPDRVAQALSDGLGKLTPEQVKKEKKRKT